MSGEKREMVVSEQESGMRLFLFLQRRLSDCPPPSVLHRWVRSGQVRVNKGRTKAYNILEAGDFVRVPPFATARQYEADQAVRAKEKGGSLDLGRGIVVLAEEDDYLVLVKPAGLAVHPGTGIDDCVTKRLKTAFSGQPFCPAPAHRLDRHVSGILLVGTSHAGLKKLSAWLSGGEMTKTYLAWVAGDWRFSGPVTLEDYLKKLPAGKDGADVVSVVTKDEPGARHSSLIAEPLARLEKGETAAITVDGATLLKINLETGRTNQIRAQLPARGHPIIGDGRHGGPRFSGLLLHAFHVALPNGKEYASLPSWPGQFTIPPSLPL